MDKRELQFIRQDLVTMEKTREKTVEKTREKMIALIIQNPQITTTEIAQQLRITVKGVEWNLKILKEKGLLKRLGPDKGGRWEVRG